MQRIGFLPIEGFALMSYACCVEPFRAANLLSGEALFETIVFGDRSTTSSSGPTLAVTQAQVGDDRKLDYLFVIAGGNPDRFNDQRVMTWLARLAREGTCIGGVSGGPVILAKAGLMSGHRMTVHWEHAAALSEKYPHLLLERSLFTFDRNRVTCAGGTAALDMMHALIEQLHGADFAGQVSDWFLHTDIRASAGSQTRNVVERVGSNNGSVLMAVAAMETQISDPFSLEHLASLTKLSPRHLNRLFRNHTGKSAIGYYRDIRLDKARNLLRNSVLGVTEIAYATGFSSSSHFAQAFRKKYGMPPSKARR